MSVIVLEPPCELINANQRLHHHAKAKLTKAWRMEAWASALQFAPRTPPVRVIVSIRFPDNRRRDVGNWYPTAKACLDGIVEAGVLPDDSDEYVTGPDMRRERPNGPLRVTVTISEVAA